MFFHRPLLEIGTGYPKQLRGQHERGVVILHDSITTRLSDLDVANVQQGCKKTEDGPLLLHTDTDRGESVLRKPELLTIVNTVDRGGIRAALIEVEELGDIIQPEILALLGGNAGT